jgi:hypothetical protein
VQIVQPKHQIRQEVQKEKQIEVRNELRERGINTYLDKETNTLKLITLKDEKAFKKEIISEEKR